MTNDVASVDRMTLETVDSTNAQAFRQADQGVATPLWIVSREQTGGRGRGARGWVSPPGNLYASLLLALDAPLATALQLPFVAGLAAHRALARCLDEPKRSDLILKWPNDILLGGAKIGGILVESRQAPTSRGGLDVVIGFGLNVAHHPAGVSYPATHLARHVSAAQSACDAGLVEKVWQLLAAEWARAAMIWDHGTGFNAIRQAWSDRSFPQGTRLSVYDGRDTVTGAFLGLDADGALLLNTPDSAHRILYGDVMSPTREAATTTDRD
ncbi:MAG: biotin--[acetyl-CoA-carboxylase] ligase [Pseudomonadota bacterium]